MSSTSTATHHPPRRQRRARSQALIADVAIGVLSFFVLLCVGLITPPLWSALVASTAPRSDASGHPAKGATAPLGNGAAGQRDRGNDP